MMNNNKYKDRRPEKLDLDPELPIRIRQLWKLHLLRIRELTSVELRLIMMIDLLAGNCNCIHLDNLYDLLQINTTRAAVKNGMSNLVKKRIIVRPRANTPQIDYYIRDFICSICTYRNKPLCTDRQKNIFINKDFREWTTRAMTPNKLVWNKLITKNKPLLLDHFSANLYRAYGITNLLSKKQIRKSDKVDHDMLAAFIHENMEIDLDPDTIKQLAEGDIE